MKDDPTLPADARFETRAIHVGQDYRSETGAVIPPIYMTSTFETGNPTGFDYTRSGNPNFRNLQTTLASLENAKHSTVFASGLSAISAILFSLKTGDTILSEQQIYGCTYRIFEKVLKRFGVKIKYANLANPENYDLITRLKPALVWLESPTNPLLKILDIKTISEAAHKVGSIVAVDNTFASSLLQQPLDLGADLSLLSTTKYTNGHSDSLGGAVCTNLDEWQEKMIFAQKAIGLQPSPFDAWLISRGAKTEAVRMERHCSNALELAQRLEGRKGVKSVKYPFLKSHPQYKLAKKQMTVKELRGTYPDYFISKNKIELTEHVDVKHIFEQIKKKYSDKPINTEDGLRIDFDDEWVHLRTSNTEPIIRIYAESKNETTAAAVASRIMDDIRSMM